MATLPWSLEPWDILGFGAAIARRFGEEGAKVIVTDINVEGGEKVAAQNPS
jgi:NAD(P)-dependent dehydrogenase (short-subunit alcohol dehydrogenase family)